MCMHMTNSERPGVGGGRVKEVFGVRQILHIIWKDEAHILSMLGGQGKTDIAIENRKASTPQ